MSLNFRKTPLVTTLFGVLSCAAFTSANPLQTYSFQFYGIETSVNNPAFQQVINGSGTFSFTSSATPINQSDLTSFLASGTFNPGHGPGYGSWTFALGDLSSFSFTANSPRSFSLATNPVLAISPLPYDASLVITGLGPNQVSLSQGTGAVTSLNQTPEPATYTLISLAGALCLVAKRLLRV